MRRKPATGLVLTEDNKAKGRAVAVLRGFRSLNSYVNDLIERDVRAYEAEHGEIRVESREETR